MDQSVSGLNSVALVYLSAAEVTPHCLNTVALNESQQLKEQVSHLGILQEYLDYSGANKLFVHLHFGNNLSSSEKITCSNSDGNCMEIHRLVAA